MSYVFASHAQLTLSQIGANEAREKTVEGGANIGKPDVGHTIAFTIAA